MDQMNLRRGDKLVALSDLSICYTLKNIKGHAEVINLKYQEQNRMNNLKYLMDLIMCQVFRTISSISSRSMKY